MIERKFTPPTSFPAEYVTTGGEKVTLLARGIGTHSLVGQIESSGEWLTFKGDGLYHLGDVSSSLDLHDLPKTKIEWMNDYGSDTGSWYSSRKAVDEHSHPFRIAVIRREWTEGELPKYFAEEV